MPIYGYRCTACGHEFEVWQSMSDARLVRCPKCEGPLQKLLYPVGVQFKGSGFYSTDYKKSSNGSKDGSSEKSSEKSATKAESKSESTTSSGSSSSEPAASGKGD